MPWEVDFHPECQAWAFALSADDQVSLVAAVRSLRDVGPALGRPLADTLAGSRYKNLKELRPPSHGGTEIRVLFAFDPVRHAILLVGGDKSSDWDGWYKTNIPIAESRFEEHVATLQGQLLFRQRRKKR